MDRFLLRAAGMLLVGLGLMTSPAIAHPSFSCSGSLSETEAVICSDDALGRLDVDLSIAYERALEDLSKRRQESMRDDQRAWLERRNECRFDKACIRSAYTDRLDELADGERQDRPAEGESRRPSRPSDDDDMVGSTFMQHNGSGIQMLTGSHGRVEFRYTNVRAGLSAREGDVLFRGTLSERGGVNGTAFVFKRGCPPAPYHVSGHQTNTRIVLKGEAPVHEPDSCSIARYDETVPSGTLEFIIAE